MLLTVLYGGIVSALGYFAIDETEDQNNRLSRTNLVLALFPFVSITLYIMDAAAGIATFLSLEVIRV